VAHGDWSTWMMWKREESKDHKAKAKVDMYLVSFCLFGLFLWSQTSHQSCFFTWPRLH